MFYDSDLLVYSDLWHADVRLVFEFFLQKPLKILATKQDLTLNELDIDILLNDSIHMVKMLRREELSLLLYGGLHNTAD